MRIHSASIFLFSHTFPYTDFEVIPMSSCDLILAISSLACCIAKGRSDDEINLLSTIFTQLGDTLATITAQQALCSGGADADTDAASDSDEFTPGH
jgi:hypothetical protein